MAAGVKVKINLKKVLKRIQKPTKKLEVKVRKKAELILKKAKEKLIKEFEAHPVTQEIRGGPSAGNPSRTLGGYGNLWSYIGFSSSSPDPTDIVSKTLKNDIKLNKTPKVQSFKTKIEYRFKINTVDLPRLETMTPMPWESGRSWLRGVERGISGFSNYMYGKTGGRSGMAFQTKGAIRAGGFGNVKYMSEILKNFKKDLKAKKGAK